MSRTDSDSKMSYLLSISLAAHFRARMAFLASVITGVKRWGILLYRVSSTRLGSIIIILRFSTAFLNRREVMMVCMVTLFPEPVVPAMRRWGIFAKLEKCDFPEIPLPSEINKG